MRQRLQWVVAVLMLLGVVLPAAAPGQAAVETGRPDTPQRVIEQMGPTATPIATPRGPLVTPRVFPHDLRSLPTVTPAPRAGSPEPFVVHPEGEDWYPELFPQWHQQSRTAPPRAPQPPGGRPSRSAGRSPGWPGCC